MGERASGPSWTKPISATKAGSPVSTQAYAVSTTFCIQVPTFEPSEPK